MARLLAGAGAALLAVAMLAAALLPVVLTSLFAASPSAAATGDIPPAYLTLYQQAAGDCPGLDWTLLAAIGKVESDHGRSTLPGATSGENAAGAGGPMQILQATFDGIVTSHRLPSGGAQPPSRYDPHDAVHAAALDLCDHGVATNVRAAVFAYNHSDIYVADVLAQADRYRSIAAVRSAWPPEQATVTDPSGTGGHVTPRTAVRSHVEVELLQGAVDKRDTLSELARRGIMTYAERATLLHRSTAQWRMGHGNVAPYELLTGSGNMALLAESLKVLRDLIDYEQFVFVPSSIKDRLLLTIGDALEPQEYAVVQTGEQAMRRIVDGGRYHPDSRRLADSFVDDMGSKVAVGVYRASAHSPATPFFAHVDRVHEAAHIAMADSLLQEHRGFPLSIDLADMACRAMFGAEAFDDAVSSAYREHGEPLRYLPERNTREH